EKLIEEVRGRETFNFTLFKELADESRSLEARYREAKQGRQTSAAAGPRHPRRTLIAQCIAGAALLALVAGSIFTILSKATLARERAVELANVTADLYGYRQFYSSWREAPDRGYYYRHYYFKPDRDDAEYTSHYVIFDPNRPNYLYYFNPQTQTYWGRYALQQEGEPRYSLLPEGKRKPRLDQIPESAFPAPGPMPPVPGTEDVTMLPPPPDG